MADKLTTFRSVGSLFRRWTINKEVCNQIKVTEYGFNDRVMIFWRDLSFVSRLALYAQYYVWHWPESNARRAGTALTIETETCERRMSLTTARCYQHVAYYGLSAHLLYPGGIFIQLIFHNACIPLAEMMWSWGNLCTYTALALAQPRPQTKFC